MTMIMGGIESDDEEIVARLRGFISEIRALDAATKDIDRQRRDLYREAAEAETKPGARRTETSVASVRSSTSRRWFAGSTREHIDQGHYIAFRRNRGHSVASFREGRD
jgi:hypothetical protein